MYRPLPTPDEMGAWDRAAIVLGVPDVVLMENAARAAYDDVLRAFGPVAGRRVLVVMGAGNNGGDAACLARYLYDAGAVVVVAHTRALGKMRGMAGRHARVAARCGVDFVPAARLLREPGRAEFLGVDLVVDGLLGTGFKGKLREAEAALVARMNELGTRAFVLALDIPSGLDGMSGRACPDAVRANLTVSFAAAKPGLVLPEAKEYVGTLSVAEIGIPRMVREAHPASWCVLSDDVIPDVGPGGHKGTAGHVVIVGGSEGLCGAPHLAGLGALRAGAGLVTLAGPQELVHDAKAGSADMMTRVLGASWGRASVAALAEWMAGLGPRAALVCGPGLGRSAEALETVATILELTERPPTVFDADALYALSERPELCALLRASDILTPHPGEAARLLRTTTERVQADRFAALAGLTALASAVWVLKGAGSLLGQQGRAGGICPVDAPNLAVGGSGDVLAGCIGAFAARGMGAYDAAAAGVARHAAAGLRLAEMFPSRGNTASDIALALSGAKLPFCCGMGYTPEL